MLPYLGLAGLVYLIYLTYKTEADPVNQTVKNRIYQILNQPIDPKQIDPVKMQLDGPGNRSDIKLQPTSSFKVNQLLLAKEATKDFYHLPKDRLGSIPPTTRKTYNPYKLI